MTALSKLTRTTAFRLSLTYLALFASGAVIIFGYIYWNTTILVANQLEGTINAELVGLAEQYRAGGLVSLTKTVAERSRTPGNSLYLVGDKDGNRLAGNLTAIAPGLWNTQGKVEFTYRRPAPGGLENRFAFASVIRLPNDYRLIVGRDIEDRRAFERVIRSAFFIGLAAMLVVGLGGGWLVSRNLLKRVDAVSATSRSIMAGDLSRRLPVLGSGDELDRLSEALNLMLTRMEQLMVGLREVSDNIAHDLKTPLNRLRNRAEAALRESSDAGSHRGALERTIEEADELIKTFNSMLSIARLEAGALKDTMESLDLAALVRDVTDLYEPAAEERGFHLDVDVPPSLPFRGDRQLLGQALANLIDNAIKYGAGEGGADGARSRIAVSLEANSEHIDLAVADDGPGVPACDRDRALKRFVRLEASRSKPGSGLGLSLAAAVARLHGGAIRLEDNHPGLRALVTLPKRPPRPDTIGG